MSKKEVTVEGLIGLPSSKASDLRLAGRILSLGPAELRRFRNALRYSSSTFGKRCKAMVTHLGLDDRKIYPKVPEGMLECLQDHLANLESRKDYSGVLNLLQYLDEDAGIGRLCEPSDRVKMIALVRGTIENWDETSNARVRKLKTPRTLSNPKIRIQWDVWPRKLGEECDDD